MTNKVILQTALTRLNNEMLECFNEKWLSLTIKEFRRLSKDNWVSALKPFNYYKNIEQIKKHKGIYSNWLCDLMCVNIECDEEDADARTAIIGRRVARLLMKPQVDGNAVPVLNERSAFVTALSTLFVDDIDWENSFCSVAGNALNIRDYMVCLLYLSTCTPSEDVLRDMLGSAKHAESYLNYAANLILS